MRTAIVVLFLAQFTWTFSSSATANTIHPDRGYFAASRSWFQLDGDAAKNLYRSYAGLIIDNDLVGFPNLFLMQCQPDNAPYLTIHFPENYAFNGFDADTWLPKTDVAVRIESGTFRFDAELNKHEFHVDLTDIEFDHFHDIWAAEGRIDFKLGPQTADMTLAFGNMQDSIIQILESNGAKVLEIYSYLQMRTRCHAASHAAAMAADKKKGWIIFGSVDCPACDGSEGKTYSFLTVDSKKGGGAIPTLAECQRLKKSFAAELTKTQPNKQPIVADLLCIGEGKWH